MRYGFVIDQDRCIGCHACTLACKEEHNVPVGVYRTWVKYIEKGEFPDVSRHFGVMRCNHCDEPPCVDICPTTALFRRPDGIVDFDNSRCIGCKSCMQACPYDALYIDPNSGTAAKCNFCAHRIELNLEPACVVVCPTRAIICGDLDNPASQPAHIVATQKVTVRKPHKGTQPKLFYVGVDGDVLQPTWPIRESTHLWAVPQQSGSAAPFPGPGQAPPRPGRPRLVYDVDHKRPWGVEITAYLFTKSIAAGAILVATFLALLGFNNERLLFDLTAPVVAMAFTAITLLLLILDLERPDRFYYLLTKANFSSWLVRGGLILMLYGALAIAWFGAGWLTASVSPIIQLSAAALGICAACYTAFLFAQAKGRDLWQSPLFLGHLLLQAIVAGSATMLLLAPFATSNPSVVAALTRTLAGALMLSLLLILGEVSLPHVSEDVKMAVDLLIRGRFGRRFWGLAIGAGLILPILLTPLCLRTGSVAPLRDLVAILALGGLWVFEDLWVRAGQAVPLS